MTKRNRTQCRTTPDHGIRELTALEAQAVGGAALSVRPDQLRSIAGLFGSAGGGTATSGLIIVPKPIKS